MMATAKALQGVILRNPAGHLHFASKWYGGRTMYREGPWEWQKPYSWSVLHAPIRRGLYNGTAAKADRRFEARHLEIEAIKAKRRKEKKGKRGVK